MITEWPALAKWTPAYLLERCGAKQGRIFITSKAPRARGAYSSEEWSLQRFLDWIQAPGYADGPEFLYLGGDNLEAGFAELLPDIQPLPFGTREVDGTAVISEHSLASVGLWIGQTGQVSSCHFDCAQNFMSVIRGQKLFRLAPPSSFVKMYGHSHASCHGQDQDGEMYRFSQVDVTNPDLKQFPHFRHVQMTEVFLQAGETLFVPIGWWHHVTSTCTEPDGVHVAVNIFFNAPEQLWQRADLRPLDGFRTVYDRPTGAKQEVQTVPSTVLEPVPPVRTTDVHAPVCVPDPGQ